MDDVTTSAASAPALLRIAIIEVEDAPRWDGFYAQMVSAFDIVGAAWTRYPLAKQYSLRRGNDGGLLPPPGSCDAAIITGSHYNVRDKQPWQLCLEAWIRETHAAGSPRLLGICYGHQIIAHALGGSVDANPGGTFVLKAEALMLTTAFSSLPFARDVVVPVATPSLSNENNCAHLMPSPPQCLVVDVVDDVADAGALLGALRIDPASLLLQQKPSEHAAASPIDSLVSTSGSENSNGLVSDGIFPGHSENVLTDKATLRVTPCLRVLESHGDCVAVLPPGAVLLASSGSCAVEMVAYYGGGSAAGGSSSQPPTIVTMQGHPEFELDSCIKERIWPAVVGERKRLSEVEQAEARASFEQPRHSHLLRLLMRRFLAGVSIDATA